PSPTTIHINLNHNRPAGAQPTSHQPPADTELPAHTYSDHGQRNHIPGNRPGQTTATHGAATSTPPLGGSHARWCAITAVTARSIFRGLFRESFRSLLPGLSVCTEPLSMWRASRDSPKY